MVRMPTSLVLAAVTLLVVLAGTAAAGDVVELDHTNFEHLTQATTGGTTGAWFVKTYAPWCGHCKKLEPDWHTLASWTKEQGLPVNIARVDATAPGNDKLAKTLGARGFPTLTMVDEGTATIFQGDRSLDELKLFVRGAYRPDATTLYSDGTDMDLFMAAGRHQNDMRFKLKAVPGPLGEVWEWIERDFETLMKNKKNIVAVIFGAGAVVGIVLGYLVGKRRRRVSGDKEKGD